MRLLPLLLLAACPQATLVVDDTGKDVDGETDADADADTDADTDTTVIDDTGETTTTTETDTGIAVMFYAGGFTATHGAYEEGWFGWGFYGLLIEDNACQAYGTMTEDGPAEHDCPQCEWTFTLSGPSDMVEEGPYCDGFWLSLTDYEDALIGWEWGFAESYALTYADQVFYLDESVLLYQDGYGFWPIAYNYRGYERVESDGDEVSFWGYASGEYYYYYLD
ncbi:MAG: hypothetical protein ACOZNI_19080 [Myxococcota bacterium]